MWLDNSFKKYKKVGLNFIYEKVENKLIEDEIDIQDIKEFSSLYAMTGVEFEIQDKLNEIIRAIKQLDNKIKEKQC